MMGYYDQTDLPYYYELASQYATSDTWFSPLLSDTIPNRMYLLTGTSFGHIRPQDVPPAGGWPQPTIFRTLSQNHISWRYYYQDSSVYLASFSDWATLPGNVYNISHYFTDLQNPSTLPQVIFIERGEPDRTRRTSDQQHPEGRGGCCQHHQRLPAEPGLPELGVHPHLRRRRRLVRSRAALRRACAGQHPTDAEDRRYRQHLRAVRVPRAGDRCRPWVKPHFVSHVNRDYTAMLKLIETRFNLPALTARDAAQDDMTEFFDFSRYRFRRRLPCPCSKRPELATIRWRRRPASNSARHQNSARTSVRAFLCLRPGTALI